MAHKSDIDFDRVNVLMQVVHNVATIAPRCTHILGAAMDELNAIDGEQQVVVRDKAAADAKAAIPAQPALVTDPSQGTFAKPDPTINEPPFSGPTPKSGDMSPGPKVIRRTAVEAPSPNDPPRLGSG